MAGLEILVLAGNKIGDSGMSALAGAITSGSLPALQDVLMFGNPGSDAPVKEAFAQLRK